jgi:hypothetical protein
MIFVYLYIIVILYFAFFVYIYLDKFFTAFEKIGGGLLSCWRFLVTGYGSVYIFYIFFHFCLDNKSKKNRKYRKVVHTVALQKKPKNSAKKQLRKKRQQPI